MKKLLTLTIIAIIALIGLSVNVNAANVSDEATLKAALVGTDTTITLTSDITLTNPIDVERQVTIDLNGHSITPANNFNSENNKDFDYVIGVRRQGDLTIKDSASNGKVGNAGKKLVVVKITVKGENDATYPAKFTLEGGIIENTYTGTDGFAAISGNGYRHNTVITIKGGTVKSSSCHAIFQPQNGELTVTGGTIEGATGIEIRSGNLTVTGGTIKGTATTVTTKSNGSGTTTVGAGIAIAQHKTKEEINVSVKGGKIEGASALYQSNVEGNATADIEKIDIEVSGGEFTATDSNNDAVYSEDKTGFITGGTFSSDVSSYVDTDLEAVKDEDGNVYVGTLHTIKAEKEGNGTVKVSKTEAVVGQKVTIEVIPEEGYRLKAITGVDGIVDVAEYAYEFKMLDKDVTITVEFEKIPVEDEEKPTTGEETTTQEPEKDEKDNTPETGSVDVVLFASTIVAVVSLAGIVMVKKYTK